MHTFVTQLRHLFNGLLVLILLVNSLWPVSPASAAGEAPPVIEPGQTIEPAPKQVETATSQTPAASGLMFIENMGQFDADARFMVRGANGTLYLADDALWFTVVEKLPAELLESLRKGKKGNIPHADKLLRGTNFKFHFPGANPHPRLEPFGSVNTTVSYFAGSDPADWQTNVPMWAGVRYVDLYPGVDLELAGHKGQLVQRLVIRDEGPDTGNLIQKLTNIRLHVGGADIVALDGHAVHLATEIGDFTVPLLQPVTADGTPVNLPISERKVNGHEITAPFVDGSTAALVPAASTGLASPLLSVLPSASDDPRLLYSTFLGGDGGDDYGSDIAVDDAGNVYLTGQTTTPDFPTSEGGFDTTFNELADAFVVKLNPDGNSLIYATFLGGSKQDSGTSIAVDAAGNVYIAGYTYSTPADNFPLYNPAQALHGGDLVDGFVAKLNAAGNTLIYSTYLGGSGWEIPAGIAVNSEGSAFVAGWTRSDDFPTRNAYQDSLVSAPDAFVTKLTTGGGALVYSTYLGGDLNDAAADIAVDSAGNACITGNTFSSDFPLAAAL
jgi:hypothetical protein